MIYEMLSGKPTFRGVDLRQTYQNVLFADVMFVPSEVFSPEAKSLISGLLQRNPLSRLGALTNPPSDLMWSEFFKGVDWKAVYERSMDGPWIPEPERMRGRKVNPPISDTPAKQIKSSKEDIYPSQCNEGGAVQYGVDCVTQENVMDENVAGCRLSAEPNLEPVSKAADSYEGFETTNLALMGDTAIEPAAGVYAPAAAEAMKGTTVPKDNSTRSPKPKSSEDSRNVGVSKRVSDAAQEQLDEDNAIYQSEFLSIRDSIILSSKDGVKGDNKLLDWSFFDENMLKSVMEDEEAKLK